LGCIETMSPLFEISYFAAFCVTAMPFWGRL